MKVEIERILEILKKEVLKWDVPVAELVKVQTNDPFKVLIATILSARTKDQTTAKVSFELFKKVKKINDFNNYSLKEIEEMIYTIGFYKNKAKYLKDLPRVLDEKFNGVIPQTVEELIELPGVGRKTANLVVSVAFDKPGICVDVHVHRIMNRFGYINTKTPFETEMKLREDLDIKHWKIVNRVLVAFGQNMCLPVSPWCSKCIVRKYCNRVNVNKSR